MLREREGETEVRRFRDWRRLDRLERPLVVLIGGTTGVGKSTLATMLASRLGITRLIATDVVRQVLRAFFTEEAMPTVHYSAFEAGGVDGYADQAEHVGTGVAAIVQRAADESKPVVVEGVHVVPGALDRELRARCVVVEALVVVSDAELHRGHFTHRRGAPAARALPAPLRSDPGAPGASVRPGAGGERGGDRERERGRGAAAGSCSSCWTRSGGSEGRPRLEVG